MQLKNLKEAQEFLEEQIPQSAKLKYMGDWGLERTKYFLKLLGNPQDKIKIIHVAGTSGKGSTAHLTSLILKNLGFKVGLTVSPQIQGITERIQINNQFISEKDFVDTLNELVPFIEKAKKSKFESSPSYFEIFTALAYYFFWKKKVDYAVIETGLGGLLDATNVVSNKNKVCVITRIGLDHTKILGKKIEDIALHKAGIIQEGNQAFSIYQSKKINKVFENQALKRNARITLLKKGANFKNLLVNKTLTSFDFNFENTKLSNLKLGLVGLHQAENCSLSLATISYLAKRDNFKFDKEKTRSALKTAQFIGRLNLFQFKNREILIDSAHNPQKMKSLVYTLLKLYPNQKLDFLVAYKKEKDVGSMLKIISPLANKIFPTSFKTDNKGWISHSEDPAKLAKTLKKMGFKNYQIIKDCEKLIEQVLPLVDKALVITGSIYLISQIYPILKKTLDNK
ncbi:hypothetical protein HYS91_01155 [Candidatus Daviesbacteria bacterium]|nr:hypothetical protein [Candidatus Daviesbacteria bacterium]